MITVFKRTDKDKQLTKNFKAGEFFCKCGKCEDQIISLDHVNKLQQLRDDFDKPILINSAYRCPEHNKAEGGSPNSRHTKGDATDIRVVGLSPKEVADRCEHFDGLGRYKTFTHIDSRGTKARWDFT